MQQDSTTKPASLRRVPHLVVGLTAAATMLVGGCGDDEDSTTTLAKGENVELVGDTDLGAQTLNLNAEEKDGKVTGEMRFTDEGGTVVVKVECADTDTDGVVILGGTITDSTDGEMSGLTALFIKEGDPDSVTVWADEGDNETCEDLLINRHDVLDDASAFVDVEDGSDIQTD